MLGKTHFVIGITAGLAVCHPSSLSELVVGAGVSAVGAVISDIDVGTSESHREANRIIALSIVIIAAVVIAEEWLHLGIYQKLMQRSDLLRIIAGALAFIGICAFGKEQPHRSFMHSILACFLLSSCVEIVFPLATPYFVVSFASHLVLDLLNRKRERLLYPLKRGFCLGICPAQGFVDRLLFSIGSVTSVGVIAFLLLQICHPIAWIR